MYHRPRTTSHLFSSWCHWAAALVVLAACGESPVSGVNQLTSRSTKGLSSADSANLPKRAGLRVGPVASVSSYAGTSIVSLEPGSYQGYDQPLAIVGTLSGPVNRISVSGQGAIKCSGSYGVIIGYDSLGAEIGRQSLSLIDPSDCSTAGNPDDVTYGAAGTLITGNSIIASFEITPMSPLVFPVFELTGRASANYTIDVGELLRISVVCSPSSVTRASASPVTCTASSTSGTVAISGWRFDASDPATGSVSMSTSSLIWSGISVASGVVTVQGTVNGGPALSDSGFIVVTPRSWNWSASKSTGNAAPGTFECNPARHYATGLFGWVYADSTCRQPGLMLWPDPTGTSSLRGFLKGKVVGGPNNGLWYVTSDNTGMHLRAQVLKDIRPDGSTYSVTGKDSVGVRCKAAGLGGNRTVTTVNNVCMADPSSFNFAAFYNFVWRHEQCHLTQALNVFPTIADPRTAVEAIVRQDTITLNSDALYGANGYFDANSAVNSANTIDVPNPNIYSFWSRNQSNTAWGYRAVQLNGILAPGC
jgi:hypothetical protein